MNTDLSSVSGATALAALLVCGVLGMLGQGVRAVAGLKNANSQGSTTPDQQSGFNAAYLVMSLMIGFIAGILAGFLVGLEKFVTLDLAHPSLLLGIAGSGYVGADFVENSMSLVIPTAKSGPAPTAAATPPAVAASRPGQAGTSGPILTAFVSAPAPVAGPPGVADGDFLSALAAVAPHVSADIWAAPLLTAFRTYHLSNDRRVAAAMGQFLVEAGAGFHEVAENLNYTHASRIADVFRGTFADEAAAQPYVGNPEKLANKVYANKLGNGDEASGDGYRYRGRGLIQLTGKAEYAEFAATIGMSASDASAYCETPAGAALSGCWYLSSRGCLPLADAWNLAAVTKRVNGSAMRDHALRVSFSNGFLNHLVIPHRTAA